jgi:hypothetical protein
MTKAILTGAALLPIALFLAACSGEQTTGEAAPPKHPAYLYIVNDVSSSARVQADDAFGNGVRDRTVQAVTELKLGDRVQMVTVGGLQADRLVGYPLIKTGYRFSLAKAGRELARQMEEVAQQARASGGDGATNIIATLSNLSPNCASGRSEIKIVSDGMESSATYDVATELAAGKAVTLPPPTTTHLRGCRVEFIGFGVVSDGSKSGGQLLPAHELEALRSGWSEYLTGAGASDVTFTSII